MVPIYYGVEVDSISNAFIVLSHTSAKSTSAIRFVTFPKKLSIEVSISTSNSMGSITSANFRLAKLVHVLWHNSHLAQVPTVVQVTVFVTPNKECNIKMQVLRLEDSQA